MSAATSALSQYVLKVHSRCDLACDHCYIYEHADQSWRGRPRAIAPATVRAAAERIAEHAATHGLPAVRLVLHGGEPLLLGVAGMRKTIETLRAAIEPVTALDLRMQTNGILLSQALCALFVEHRVRIGVSFDGYAEAHDRHRRFTSGAGSHAEVRRALALLRLPANRPCYGGLLCTIDVANDPIRVYEALLAEEPPRIDFLLPHATWDNPPVRPDGAPTPYADWLLAIHRRWLADGQPVPVRLFDSLRATASGRPSQTESLGLAPADLAVIETDGTWEQADSLKTAFDGAPETGLNVFAHTVDEVAAHPGIAGRQLGLESLCDTCRACPVVHQCGGGLYAHRYRTGNGFDNPSVYCDDLKTLIVSANRVTATVASAPLPDLVARLAARSVDTGVVAQLAAGQLAVNRGLLARVAAADGEPDAWECLAALDERYPEATGAVLRHPYVRTWAARRLAGGPPDHGYLIGLAIGAAIQAGAGAALPFDGDRLPVPGLGTVLLPDAGRHMIRVVDGRYAGTGHWRPLRRIELDGWPVALDDADPYRDCLGAPAEPADDAWPALLARTWAQLAERFPEQVPVVRAAIGTVTPLAAPSRHGLFGALGLTRDTSADQLVAGLRRSLLAALLDRYDLVDHGPARLALLDAYAGDRPTELLDSGALTALGVRFVEAL